MFNFNEEQMDLKKMVEEFVEKHIEPGANDRNNNQTFSKEIFKEMAEMGYLGMVVPAEYDGCEMDHVSSASVIHEIAKSDASLAHLVSAGNYTFCYPILKHGTEDQKKQYLKKCALGEKVGVLACTEPTIECKTAFSADDEQIILNGTKSFVTAGRIADYVLVMATESLTGPELDRLTFFIVDIKNVVGEIEISNDQETMGLNTIQLVEMHFKNVVLGKENLIGEINGGKKILLDLANFMRLGDSAIALGLAERAYQEALSYMKVRTFNNAPLLQMQSVRYQLAEIKADMELMKLSVYYIADNLTKQCGNPIVQTAILKLNITEKAKDICDKCLQMFGGYGYIRGNTIERLYREVRAMTITGGHSDKMKVLISQFL